MIVDIRDPGTPVVLSQTLTPRGRDDGDGLGHRGLRRGQHVGLQVYDVTNPASPALVGNFPSSLAGDVVVSGTEAFLADGYQGLKIVRVSKTAAPALFGSYDTPGSSISLVISGNEAYVADMIGGFQIIDIHDRADPALLGSLPTAGVAQDVAVSGSYAYVAEFQHGLGRSTSASRGRPARSGCSTLREMATRWRCRGTRAYLADGSAGLRIIDVGTAGPAGSVRIPGRRGVAVSGNVAYVANGSHGLLILDVHDPKTPTLLATVSATTSGRWRIGVSGLRGRYSGLVIIDEPATAPVVLSQTPTPGTRCR